MNKEIWIKLILTSLVVVVVSEMAKKSSIFGALIASLPLTSILAMIWLYRDTGDVEKVIHLSNNIFWAVIPSLAFFLVFPSMLKLRMPFTQALILSCLIMSIAYGAFLKLI